MNGIILINLVTLLIGIFIFLSLDLRHFANEKISDPIIKINRLILQSKDTWIYIIQITSSLLLIALIPLLASSDHIALTQNLPPLLRQSLWSVEAITMIFGSIIYLVAKRSRENEIMKAVLMLNSIFLFLFLYFNQAYMIVSIVMFISMLIMISFYVFRDDYVITAKNDARLIEAHASFSSVMKDLICSISPVILSYLLSNFKLDMAIITLLVSQLVLYAVYLLLARKKSYAWQAETV